MDVIKIVGIAMTAAMLAMALRKTSPEFSLHISIAAGILILLMSIDYISQSVEFIKNIAKEYSFAYEAVEAVLKITGIAYICEFTAQVLSDAGEGALAKKTELAGKLIILTLTLPLLGSFFETVTGLLR